MGVLLRQAYNAGKSGDWANYLEVFLANGKLSGTSAKVTECYQSIVQDILRNSTDFLRRNIVPVESQGGVTLSYVCSHSRLKTGHEKKQCKWWCEACGGKYDRKNGATHQNSRTFGTTCGTRRLRALAEIQITRCG